MVVKIWRNTVYVHYHTKIVLSGLLSSSLFKKYYFNLGVHTGNGFNLGNAGGLFIVSGLFGSDYHLAIGAAVYRSGYSTIREILSMGNIKFQSEPNIGGAEIYAYGTSSVWIQTHAAGEFWIKAITAQ